ncbi:MAG: glutamate-1-semialdehyde-2,1-aminomutase [Chloroflexi bacterium]|nr:MAG: glutamate-1-semialdehyde-2,1-aminomutase [Chloroflexota bacterium]
MNWSRSQRLFEEAQQWLVGGVNSPVRAFKAVGGTPLFISRGQGSRIYTAEGHELVDYVGSWGPLILGHAHPQVVAALKVAVEEGTSYGAPTEREIELARLIHQAMPAVEKVRFVNSGTEATMSALRLARAYTGRAKIVKFAGGYHGHADFLLVQAGSGVTTLGLPGSAGVPPSVVQDTLVAPYNDLEAVSSLFETFPDQIAAVIVEPVAGNMGVVPPVPGFLEGLRRLTQEHGALLIFDEVITGFRVAYGGAQALYGIQPDLTCLGKVIGGGLPVGAYGGRREVMDHLAPLGPVYQAGTLSGNPLAMAAGIATLKVLAQPGTYERLEERAGQLAQGLEEAARQAGVPLQINRVGSMLTPFFTDRPVRDYTSAKAADAGRYARFFWGLVNRGVYPPPSAFESWFVSLAHTAVDVTYTIEVSRQALREVG